MAFLACSTEYPPPPIPNAQGTFITTQASNLSGDKVCVEDSDAQDNSLTQEQIMTENVKQKITEDRYYYLSTPKDERRDSLRYMVLVSLGNDIEEDSESIASVKELVAQELQATFSPGSVSPGRVSPWNRTPEFYEIEVSESTTMSDSHLVVSPVDQTMGGTRQSLSPGGLHVRRFTDGDTTGDLEESDEGDVTKMFGVKLKSKHGTHSNMKVDEQLKDHEQLSGDGKAQNDPDFQGTFGVKLKKSKKPADFKMADEKSVGDRESDDDKYSGKTSTEQEPSTHTDVEMRSLDGQLITSSKPVDQCHKPTFKSGASGESVFSDEERPNDKASVQEYALGESSAIDLSSGRQTTKPRQPKNTDGTEPTFGIKLKTTNQSVKETSGNEQAGNEIKHETKNIEACKVLPVGHQTKGQNVHIAETDDKSDLTKEIIPSDIQAVGSEIENAGSVFGVKLKSTKPDKLNESHGDDGQVEKENGNGENKSSKLNSIHTVGQIDNATASNRKDEIDKEKSSGEILTEPSDNKNDTAEQRKGIQSNDNETEVSEIENAASVFGVKLRSSKQKEPALQNSENTDDNQNKRSYSTDAGISDINTLKKSTADHERDEHTAIVLSSQKSSSSSVELDRTGYQFEKSQPQQIPQEMDSRMESTKDSASVNGDDLHNVEAAFGVKLKSSGRKEHLLKLDKDNEDLENQAQHGDQMNAIAYSGNGVDVIAVDTQDATRNFSDNIHGQLGQKDGDDSLVKEQNNAQKVINGTGMPTSLTDEGSSFQNNMVLSASGAQRKLTQRPGDANSHNSPSVAPSPNDGDLNLEKDASSRNLDETTRNVHDLDTLGSDERVQSTIPSTSSGPKLGESEEKEDSLGGQLDLILVGSTEKPGDAGLIIQKHADQSTESISTSDDGEGFIFERVHRHQAERFERHSVVDDDLDQSDTTESEYGPEEDVKKRRRKSRTKMIDDNSETDDYLKDARKRKSRKGTKKHGKEGNDQELQGKHETETSSSELDELSSSTFEKLVCFNLGKIVRKSDGGDIYDSEAGYSTLTSADEEVASITRKISRPSEQGKNVGESDISKLGESTIPYISKNTEKGKADLRRSLFHDEKDKEDPSKNIHEDRLSDKNTSKELSGIQHGVPVKVKPPLRRQVSGEIANRIQSTLTEEQSDDYSSSGSERPKDLKATKENLETKVIPFEETDKSQPVLSPKISEAISRWMRKATRGGRKGGDESDSDRKGTPVKRTISDEIVHRIQRAKLDEEEEDEEGCDSKASTPKAVRKVTGDIARRFSAFGSSSLDDDFPTTGQEQDEEEYKGWTPGRRRGILGDKLETSGMNVRMNGLVFS